MRMEHRCIQVYMSIAYYKAALVTPLALVLRPWTVDAALDCH